MLILNNVAKTDKLPASIFSIDCSLGLSGVITADLEVYIIKGIFSLVYNEF